MLDQAVVIVHPIPFVLTGEVTAGPGKLGIWYTAPRWTLEAAAAYDFGCGDVLYERLGGACRLPFCVETPDCLEKEERLGSDAENEEVDIGPADVKVEELDAS